MLSRRSMLSQTVGGLTLLPSFGLRTPAALARSTDSEPHFFLQIVLGGGVDASYIFDARPLAMTQANLIHNYLKAEPKVYRGVNGQQCLFHSPAQLLQPFLSKMAIINGVHMAAGFDGHRENLNAFIGEKASGGRLLAPELSHKAGDFIDFVQCGGYESATIPFTNTAKGVTLDVAALKALGPLAASAHKLGEKAKREQRHLISRMAGYAPRENGMAKTGNLMGAGLEESTRLAGRLAKLSMPSVETGPLAVAQLIGECFRHNIAGSALYFEPEANVQLLDAHDGAKAKQQPARIKTVLDNVSAVLKYFENSPYDEQRSLLDLTTVLIGSEFSRTMRLKNQSVDKTGTDHNPHSNSIFLLGKGIRGGLVVGASDFRTANEKLSGAHLSVDPLKKKVIGLPFDCQTMQVVDKLPDVYEARDYLSYNSVVNTIYSIFGVPKDSYRRMGINSDVAPVIPRLLG